MGFIEDLVQSIRNLAEANPTLGIFLASLLGNVIPFFPVPYLLLVIFIAQIPGGPGLVQLATVGAIGASIGKFASYTLGYGAGKILPGARERFDSLRKLLGGSAFLAAFIFAAGPFPDDVIFIPLGLIRYSPTKTFIALFSGKFVLTLSVAFLSRSSGRLLDEVTGSSPVAAIASAIAVVIIAFIMMRVDWEKVLAKRRNGFIRRFLRRLRYAIKKGKVPPEQSKDSLPASEPDSAA